MRIERISDKFQFCFGVAFILFVGFFVFFVLFWSVFGEKERGNILLIFCTGINTDILTDILSSCTLTLSHPCRYTFTHVYLMSDKLHSQYLCQINGGITMNNLLIVILPLLFPILERTSPFPPPFEASFCHILHLNKPMVFCQLWLCQCYSYLTCSEESDKQNQHAKARKDRTKVEKIDSELRVCDMHILTGRIAFKFINAMAFYSYPFNIIKTVFCGIYSQSFRIKCSQYN